ncbi:MAG: hypothetical protein ACTSQP_15895 [Promethearchaeota archaeon]
MLSKEEIENRLKRIFLQMESPDEKFQSAALNAFINLLENETLTKNQKRKMISILKKFLVYKDSPLRTEIFQVICAIGKKDFTIIEELSDDLVKEIEVKNRYRNKIIFDMFANLRNSNNPRVQSFFKDLIEKTPNWFDEPHLIPIIEEFWEKSTESGFELFEKYLPLITKSIESYPAMLENLKIKILNKIKDYNDYLELVRKRKEEEAKKREEKLRKQEELKKQKAALELKRKLEREKMKKELESYVNTLNQKKESVNFSKQVKVDQKISVEESLNNENSAIQINSEEQNNLFPTFTSLGLKRKKDVK